MFGKEAGAPIAGPALVVAELRARQLDRAAEVAASLIERDAKNPVYHTLLGEVRAAQQDYPAAESALRAALAVDPDLTAATGDLAQIYIATGRIDEARNLYNDLLAKNPNEVGALLGLANTYIAQQKWNDAIDALNRARTVARNDPGPGLKLVGVYEKRQDWTKAKTVAAELAAQFPANAYILDAAGQAQLVAGIRTVQFPASSGPTRLRRILHRSCRTTSPRSAARNILPRPAGCSRKPSRATHGTHPGRPN